MTREDLDFIGSMNMCDEISNEAYKKIVCHFEGQEPKTEPCEDCIRKQDEIRKAYDRGIKNGLIPRETCEDCISRQAVIDAINANSVWENEYNLTSNRIKKAVEKLPSVTPQEKTGHWIDGHCSECGCDAPAYIIDWQWQKDMEAKYCPNCGCRMEMGVSE